MKLHHLKPAEGSKTRKKRMARGDRGRGGKTAGRGTKGTGARGSGKIPAGFEGGQMPMIRRQPKLPGFTNPNKIEYAVVNVGRLDAAFDDGAEVSVVTLTEKGMVKRNRPVKILGHGELSKQLTVDIAHVSANARDKITAAGGTVVA